MEYGKIVELVNKILSQYTMPLTLRQVFYRLVADYNYPNTKPAYTQLSKQLVEARERGDIDETRIEDRSREFLGGDQGFDGLEEFLDYQINEFLSSPKYYCRKMWTEQPKFVVVWVEKDALSKIISSVAERYNVITAPSRGYASYTYIKQAIEMFPIDKEIVILHFADHDPSGLDMTRDLQERFNDYYSGDVKVERVALTYSQVQKYHLSPNPTKTADPRATEYISRFGNQCWELDALDPNELQKLVLESIKRHIDAEKWNKTLEEERQERQELEKIFQKLERNLKKWAILEIKNTVQNMFYK
jgi:hypothetical protein